MLLTVAESNSPAMNAMMAEAVYWQHNHRPNRNAGNSRR